MSANILVVFPVGSLSAKDRERLSKNGYCAVEATDPSKVQIILPALGNISGDDFSMAALSALLETGYDEPKLKFTKNLLARLKAKASSQP